MSAFRTCCVMLLLAVIAVPAAAADTRPASRHPFFATFSSPPREYRVRLERSLMVPMRDGVRLSTDVYFPIGTEGRWPVVLIRTPYDKNQYRRNLATQDDVVPVEETRRYWEPVFFAQRGYIVVVQDHRGRNESEGEFFAYPATDGPDGYDTLSWIAGQSWASGKVGTIGCSYVGETQQMLAAQRHPNHTTAISEAGSASAGAGGVWNFGFTRYGTTELAAALSWSYQNAGLFTYGPPLSVDRQAWMRSPEARLYRTKPVMEPRPTKEILRALQALPVIDAMQALAGGPVPSAFEDWLRYADDPSDAYWSRQGLLKDSDRFSTPTLHVNSWYDITPNSTLKQFNLFARNATTPTARDHQYLIMAAATHCGFIKDRPIVTKVGDREVGVPYLDYPAIFLAWFDHWLKGTENGITRMPKVSSFVLGRDRWRTSDVWPLRDVTLTKWYLDGSDANSRLGGGRLTLQRPSDPRARDAFVYDPKNPVPTVGGSICCTGPEVKDGGVDQRDVELRRDVLVYTSEALKTGIEVVGALQAVLYVGSSAKDTDFVAKLVDVYPDGTAYIVQEGVMRARWREGFARKVFMTPGEVYEVRVDLESTHNYFAPGHRLRLDISSSSFPRWDRNLNTGGANFDEHEAVVATNFVHRSARHASHLVLPVLSARQSVIDP